MTSVIIYILSYNKNNFDFFKTQYSKYSWAKPILLKSQDFFFENMFWRQLNEYKSEWENVDMVGTLLDNAFTNIDLEDINEVINNKLYYPSKYYNFMNSNISIPNENTDKHPNFTIIWNDILDKLKLTTTTENSNTYWMCSPPLMTHFINWYTNICLPILKSHPLIFSDAKYKRYSNNNEIIKKKLIKKWGVPHYPHFPFIAKRLNKCFFETYYPNDVEKPNNFCWKYYTMVHSHLRGLNKIQAKSHFYKYGQFENRKCNENNDDIKNELIRYNNLLPKLVFLISHEKIVGGGAQNCLYNMENIYKQNNIKTELIYLEDIKFNIVEYILNKCASNNCSPVVICNTLVCYNIVKILSQTNILTYWYIHEWYDDFMHQNFKDYFKNCIEDHNIFDSSINIIFACNSSVKNYNSYIPIINNYTIAYNYNSYSPKILDEYLSESQNKIIKHDDILYLSIIGTVEKRKQQQSFIDNVFYKLKNKYSNIKLILVGRISESLVIDPLYANDIIIIGTVNNALPYINLSDIIISYSVNDVLPLSIIESFYCKKAVVSTIVGGIPEIIEDNYNGFLIEKHEHTKCFTILCSLIENSTLRETIGERAKNTFLKKFNNKYNIELFLSLLKYK